MMHLPAGGNWEKVLLLNRNTSSTIENDALVDEDGNFVLNESEQLKLFALRAKLSNLSDSNTEVLDERTKDYTFVVGKDDKNIVNKNISIDDSVEKAIEYLSTAILYSSLTSSEIEVILENAIETYTPHSDIYQDMKTSETEVIDDTELAIRKKAFFKKRLEEELLLNKNAMETKLYYYLKDLL